MIDLLYYLTNLIFFDIPFYLHTYVIQSVSIICFVLYGDIIDFPTGGGESVSSVLLEIVCGMLLDAGFVILYAILLPIKSPVFFFLFFFFFFFRIVVFEAVLSEYVPDCLS